MCEHAYTYKADDGPLQVEMNLESGSRLGNFCRTQYPFQIIFNAYCFSILLFCIFRSKKTMNHHSRKNQISCSFSFNWFYDIKLRWSEVCFKLICSFQLGNIFNQCKRILHMPDFVSNLAN